MHMAKTMVISGFSCRNHQPKIFLEILDVLAVGEGEKESSEMERSIARNGPREISKESL